MKTSRIFFIGFLSFLIINSCSVTEKSQESIKFSVQGGLSEGGIIENTDLTVVPNVKPAISSVDAYSGATSKNGFNVGVHLNKPFKYFEIESGLDYMYNAQKFTYADSGNMYIGYRDLSVSQLMIPIIINYVIFKKIAPENEVQLKFGYLGELNFISVSESGILPDYSINKFSHGVIFGVSAYVVKFNNGSKLGVFFEEYKGSQIYEDYYNQKSFSMPSSCFRRVGLKYRFK